MRKRRTRLKIVAVFLVFFNFTLKCHCNEDNTNLEDGVLGSALAAIGVAQQDVLRFEVSVDDAFGLQDVHGLGDLSQEHADGALA